MNILLIGEIYSENLGDPLLCQTVEALILEKYPDAEITRMDMSGKINGQMRYGTDGNGRSFRDGLDTLWLYSLVCRDRKLYHAFAKDHCRYIAMWCCLCRLMREHRFDVAVFAGGSVFMDYFAGVVSLIVTRLAVSGVKTVFHACGMSTLGDEDQALLCKAFRNKNVVFISLRDGYNRFCSLFPVGDKAVETYDTALNCSLLYPPAEKKTAQYGIGLIGRAEYFEEQVQLIRQLRQSHLDWKVFTNGAGYDEKAAKEILLAAGIEEAELEAYLTRRPATASELVKTVTQFERIISFRMHSQITAASFGIPCYGIAWDPKIVDFFSKLGFPENTSRHVGSLEQMRRALCGCEATIHENARKQAQISRNHLYEGIQIAIESR